MVRGSLLVTAVAVVVVGAAAVVAAVVPGREVAGSPVPYCTVLRLLFDTDEGMRRAAEGLRADPRVREVRELRTKSENHDRLTAALRAQGRHALADATRVGSTPASLQVVEAFGVDVGVLAGELRRGHRVNRGDVCADPGVADEVG